METEIMLLQTGEHAELPAAARSWDTGMNGSSPEPSEGAPSTPGAQASGLHGPEMSISSSKPPSPWYFATAALVN